MRIFAASLAFVLIPSAAAGQASEVRDIPESMRQMMQENADFGRKALIERLSDEKLIAALAMATHRYYTELIKAGFSEAAALEIVKSSDLIRGVSR